MANIASLRYLLTALLMATVSCGPKPPPAPSQAGEPVSTEGNQVTLSARLSAAEYRPGEDIHMTAVVRNNGDHPVTLEEGRFMAVFIVAGEARTFLETVRASYASGFKTITVKPGEVYEEPFIIHPKDWGRQQKLIPGQYRVRVCYSRSAGSWHPTVNREANTITDGAVGTLGSDEIVVSVK